MSLRCQQCGSVQVSGKFCPSCGGPLAPIAEAAQPQQPQPFPPVYPPPAPPPAPVPAQGGGKGWGLWAAIGGSVVVLGGLAAFLLLREPAAPTPAPTKPPVAQNDPAKPAPAPQPQPAAQGLKKISQGSFGARPSSMVVSGSYLGYGTDSVVAFYKFDGTGKAKELARVQVKDPVGKLKSIVVGDFYNDGRTFMFALFEKKLMVIGESGGVLQQLDTNGVDNILLGDFDGDGKNETVYLGLDQKGTYGFDVWRYPSDKWEYRKEGRQQAWPELFQTDLKSGKNSLLMGYAFEGNDLYLLTYKWDGAGGPVVNGKYLVENKAEAPVEWIASGTTGYGNTLAVVRSGAKASVEVLTAGTDGKTAKSVGRFAAEGTGRPAVIIGRLTGQGSQMLSVDEAGNYTLFDLGK